MVPTRSRTKTPARDIRAPRSLPSLQSLHLLPTRDTGPATRECWLTAHVQLAMTYVERRQPNKHSKASNHIGEACSRSALARYRCPESQVRPDPPLLISTRSPQRLTGISTTHTRRENVQLSKVSTDNPSILVSSSRGRRSIAHQVPPKRTSQKSETRESLVETIRTKADSVTTPMALWPISNGSSESQGITRSENHLLLLQELGRRQRRGLLISFRSMSTMIWPPNMANLAKSWALAPVDLFAS